ncbi:4-diphosphocytidyl-2-C-methyl-D-erythritol kinase [Neorhizobium galegae]|uniref:4-(cytidine 5'-diphospho)-2-C-methyl-D-erythritol kinase n=1 Tax=Neorhizobium galegae TaxID=399 RepID=UPI001AEAF431|nr:4-(cytidine 5'-diphospho)-2-C-methyl-D-erythritol kinase [Neorhizobium galegae]MBP2547829.1 4-diphosphocytidyl-2-C-methyl-D-erythritol kinase [Neorhizobium galegae]
MTASGLAPDSMAAGVTERAPAKVNLCLHVTGRRPDGYHLLDSLVTFATHGDTLTFSQSTSDSFAVTGRFGESLSAAADNLVVRARDRLRAAIEALGLEAPPVAITLQKDLPIASGIGGGSADAAATLRGLQRLWSVRIPKEPLADLALALGADVPMCLSSRPLMARGIGEELVGVENLPALFMVLVNPLVSVSTPDIFRRLTRRDNAPVPPLPERSDDDWLSFIATLRNDLEPPARAAVSEIGVVSQALAETGAPLVRMSGSGATCFGLYPTPDAAQRAAKTLTSRHPAWYVQATTTIAGEAT